MLTLAPNGERPLNIIIILRWGEKKRKWHRKETTNNDEDFSLVKQSQFNMEMLNEKKKKIREKSWIVFIVVVSIFDI